MKFNRGAVIVWSAGVCAGAAALAAVLPTIAGSGWHIAVLALGLVAVVALLVLIIAALPFGSISRLAGRPQPVTPEDIDRARINLHAVLSGAWSQEGSEVYEDLPMRVRFARVDGVAPKHSQTGDFDGVAKAFSQVPRYRRVVLGEAGAGKTVLVKELQRRLVEAPRPGDPLPVIVPAAAWRPDKQSLLDWLADQLKADYGWLPVAHARALVARGVVLPILDGLDEMRSSLRPVAIARINKYHAYRPLIVTSREREYRDAVRETRAGVKGSVVVAVQPLRPKDTRAYLDAAGGDRWASVLSEMDADNDGALARVLANPLMLWLARVEYEESSPEELILFGSRRPLEDYLLRRFVPSAYTDDSRQDVARQFRCTAQQATRWLGHLASNIYQQYWSNQQAQEDELENEREAKNDGRRADIGGAPVLAWWDIRRLAGRWRRLGMALRAAILCSVGLALGIQVLEQHGNWRHGAYSGPVNFGDLLLGGPVGQHIRLTIQVLARAGQGIGKHGEFVATLHSIGAVFSVILSVIFWRPFLTVLAVALFAVVGTKDSWVPVRLRFRAGGVLRALVRCCFLLGMAALAAALLLNFAHWPVSASVFFGSRSTWITLVAVSLLGLISLPGSFFSQSDTYGNLSPDESLRLDRQADAVVTISKRSLVAVAAWLFCGPQVAVAYAGYAVTATVVALGLGGQRSFASRAYVDTRNWLAIQGQVPWRTMTFLADASQRGVLRQVGAAYQFRHIRLLEQVRYWRSGGDWGWLNHAKAYLRELTEIAHGLIGRHDEMLDGTREAVKHHRQEAEAGVELLPSGFAENLEDLAGRLRRWPDEPARAALRDVLDTYRMLADADPAAFSPGLARLLRESASAFRWDEAMRVTTEAVGYYRELAQTDPAAFLPGLAEALTDLVGWLRGRSDQQARAALRDGFAVYWKLAETDPAAFRPTLARVLRELASVCRWDQALRVSRLAEGYYRQLAQTDPAAFLPARAEAVSDLADRLRRLGCVDEALKLTREIVDSARDLAESGLVLADSLSDLSDWLWESKSRRQESVSASREAATIYGELTKANPDRFRSRLASAWDTLVHGYRALRRQEDELLAIRNALDAYGERAKRIIEIHHQIAGPELAVLLQRRQEPAIVRQAFGRARSHQHKKALAAARNAAATCGELADSQPTEFLPDLANAADGLAIELKSAGRPREARILAGEADQIRSRYRQLVNNTHRQARETWPVDRVDDLALRLWKLGEHKAALEACQISRNLAPASRVAAATASRGHSSPDRWLTPLREKRQLQWWQNRVSFCRKNESEVRLRATRDPEARNSLAQAQQDLATALKDQSDALDTLAFQRQSSDRSGDARVAALRALWAQEESVAIYREIYGKLPPSSRSNLVDSLANALNTLALRLHVVGRSKEAARASGEASEIRQREQAPPTALLR